MFSLLLFLKKLEIAKRAVVISMVGIPEKTRCVERISAARTRRRLLFHLLRGDGFLANGADLRHGASKSCGVVA